MILHLSIPADDPKRVAEVLAEITDGEVTPFPALKGGYFVHTNKERDMALEVWPKKVVLVPDEDQSCCHYQKQQISQYSPVHFAFAIQTDVERLRAIAEREGWAFYKRKTGRRDNLYEFWVENNFMIEFIVS